MSVCETLHIDVIDEIPTLHSIWAEYAALVNSIPRATPSQTPEWQLTWWNHYGGEEIRVLAFRNSRGVLVGLIPAFQHMWQGRRQITLIGSGISDDLEPPVQQGYQDAVLCCLAKYLRQANDWEVCDWQDLEGDTPLASLAQSRGLHVRLETETPCSEINIEGAFTVYWAQRSSGLRRNIRRYRQKAEQAAPLETHVYKGVNEGYLEALIRLHSLRWREQGESGTIAANKSAAFLRDVVEEFAKRDMLLFFALHYGAVISAVILVFPYRNMLYAYLSGFDPAYSSFGLGSLLLHDSLEHAFSCGYRAWNFLRGEEAYKFEFGARKVPKSRLIITRA